MSHAPELESVIDEWAPAFGAEERTRGVVDAQGAIALRISRLCRNPIDGRQALERPIPGFNERERGEILHGALERIWSELLDSKRLAALGGQQRVTLLNASVRAAIAGLCRRRDPGARWRERERVRLTAS